MYKSRFQQPNTNLHVNNGLFKMGTHRIFRPYHKAFKVTRDGEIVLKNVTMNCFMAQTKLRSHVEVQNTKKVRLTILLHAISRRVQYCALLKNF